MAIPPLILRIYADSSGVKRGVAQANAQVGGMRTSFVRNSKLIGAALTVAVVGGMVKAVQAAGDLGEAINAANVTFGRSRGIVRAWAKDAATSAGLAEAEALQAAAGFGAMLDSAGIAGDEAANMSVKVGQLAADIGSLRNADPTDMLDRMRAGLAGEAEPLRRFGIFLSEARVQAEAYRSGIAKAGDELTDAQKIQARYNIILEDSQKAAGDFARTAGESLPNQLRILRAQLINIGAQLGEVLLPIIVKVLSWVNALLMRMGQWARTLDKEVGPAVREAWVEVQKMWKELQPLLVELKPVAALLGGAFLNNLRLTAGAIRVVASTVRALVFQLQIVFSWIKKVVQALGELAERAGGVRNIIPPLSGAGLIGRLLGKQHGGYLTAGTPAVIGEGGPELFVPKVSGTIVPNGEGGSGTIVVNVKLGDEPLATAVVRGIQLASSQLAAV